MAKNPSSDEQRALSDKTLNVGTVVKPLQLAGMKQSRGVSVSRTDFSPQKTGKEAGHELKLLLHERLFHLAHHSSSVQPVGNLFKQNSKLMKHSKNTED